MTLERAARHFFSSLQGDDPTATELPPATPAQLDAARVEHELPERYAEFLKVSNGAGLLFGTEELGGDEREQLAENMSYDDDLDEEVAEGFVIGGSLAADLTVVMLADGRVAEYEDYETEFYPSLEAWLVKVAELLDEANRERNEIQREVEHQWTAEARAALEAAALEAATTRVRDATAAPEPSPEALATLGDPAAPQVELSLLQEEGKAATGLGLMLFLYAAPSPEEICAAARIFREHSLPIEEHWSYAGDGAVTELEPAGAEPWADGLRVRGGGHYGLRLLLPDPNEESPGAFLNIRRVPDDAGVDGEAIPLTPFVEAWFPATDFDAQRLESLTRALVDVLPVRSGHAGWTALTLSNRGWGPVEVWCERFFGIVPGWVDGWLPHMFDAIRGPHWLTILGAPLAQALGELPSRPDLTVTHGDRVVIVRAGECELGDMAHGEFPAAMAAVARWVAPLLVEAEAVGIPAFGLATDPWVRRFFEPEAAVPWEYLGGGDRALAFASLRNDPRALERLTDAGAVANLPGALEFAKEAVRARQGSAIALILDMAVARPDGGGEFLDLVRPFVDASVGERLAQAARREIPDDFARARVMFDLALTRDDLQLTHYLSASWATMEDNASLPIIPDQLRRIYAAARPKAPEYPGLFLNLVCMHHELGEPEQALDVLAEALQGGHVGASEFEKDPLLAELRATARYAEILGGIETTRTANLQLIELWKDWLQKFPTWSIGRTRPLEEPKLLAHEGVSSAAASRIKEFAITRKGSVLLVYSEDGAFDRGPVMLVPTDGPIAALGHDVGAALAIVNQAGEDVALESVVAGGQRGEVVAGFEAWLSGHGVSRLTDVAAAIESAAQAYAKAVGEVRRILGRSVIEAGSHTEPSPLRLGIESIPVAELPADLSLLASKDGVDLLDEFELAVVSGHNVPGVLEEFLDSEPEKDADHRANVRALRAVLAHCTFVLEAFEDNGLLYGYWHGADDSIPLVRAPIVTYDSEGQLELQPEASILGALCSRRALFEAEGEGTDESDVLAALHRRFEKLGLAFEELEYDASTRGPGPEALHESLYDQYRG